MSFSSSPRNKTSKPTLPPSKIPLNSLWILEGPKNQTTTLVHPKDLGSFRESPIFHPAKIDLQPSAGECCKSPMRLASLLDGVGEEDSKPDLLALFLRVDEWLVANLAFVDVHHLSETLAWSALNRGVKRDSLAEAQVLGEELKKSLRTKLNVLIFRVVKTLELEWGARRVLGCGELVALSADVIYIKMSARFNQAGGTRQLALVIVLPGELLLLGYLHHVVELLELFEGVQKAGLLHRTDLVQTAVQV